MSSQARWVFEGEQYRIYRLQVFNWGTFSGLHDIPISKKGFLFVGGSGTGKTTLLDAFSSLLIPPRWIEFNAAAREADGGRRDRSLVSYIRGAWAAQKDEDSGMVTTQYLRKQSTWSALSLSYRNSGGQNIVLVQLFFIRGSANTGTDVKRHYFIFEREFSLREMEDFGKSNFDIRKLKQSFQDIFCSDVFDSYRERFSRLLGIGNEMALKLLHKTQSAKNMGDLNIFLREFMLDKPKTFDAADTLVNEFGELDNAHQAVVTARRQIETLIPAREMHTHMETIKKQLIDLKELEAGIEIYRETRLMFLLKERIASLTIEADGLHGEIDQRQSLLDNQKTILDDLQRRHREIGGEQIEQWEKEKENLEGQRSECIRKREIALSACRELGWSLDETPQGFARITGKANEEIDGLDDRKESVRNELALLAVAKKDAENEFNITVKEVRSLERQPSNIPASMLDLRKDIASATGISEAALPFVGELIEVRREELSWQGVIERVLHGFALSLLVDERHYNKLSKHINSTHLGNRLVYYRTESIEQRQQRTLSANSMILKLNVKEGTYSDWLKAQLHQRFDYSCVDSVQAFRIVERAITLEGLVKHNRTRHEKDDRYTIGDRSNWILGFNNREKLALFKQKAQDLAEKISSINEKNRLFSEQDTIGTKRAMLCQTLVNLQWHEIDVIPLIDRIAVIEKEIREKRDGNKGLHDIAYQIDKQKNTIKDEESVLYRIKGEHDNTLNLLKTAKDKLNEKENDPSIVNPTPFQKSSLDERYAKAISTARIENLRIDNLDRVTIAVVQSLNEEINKNDKEIMDCENKIVGIFKDFKRTWPADASDLDISISSAQEYFAKLARLETDGLPTHEQRFFDLLKNQSYQNLASLSTYLNNERKIILDRMDLVNDSLKQVPFNQSGEQKTFLCIDVNDRQLQEVREFKQAIQQALSHAWSEDLELAEDRFLTLRRLVERLSSQDPEKKRWKESVLDVRLHVEFIGRETDENNGEIEIYRSGAGKSGGQRQKLTTTCLAAALRYQLGGNDLGLPVYSPVILDEAFDKADNEFTALAMNIFGNFGFQMIVATPLKSVMTLEPFIGGACFVDIKNRNTSSVLNIKYDDERQRLDLATARKEEENEIS